MAGGSWPPSCHGLGGLLVRLNIEDVVVDEVVVEVVEAVEVVEVVVVVVVVIGGLVGASVASYGLCRN